MKRLAAALIVTTVLHQGIYVIGKQTLVGELKSAQFEAATVKESLTAGPGGKAGEKLEELSSLVIRTAFRH